MFGTQRSACEPCPAMAADFAVWLLVDVMTSSGGVPEGYRPASARAIILLCLILFADLWWQHRGSQLRIAPPHHNS